MKKIYLSILLFVITFQTTMLFAADDAFIFQSGIPNQPTNFMEIICIVVKLALDFIPYLIVLAIAPFLQGLIKYVGNGDNEEKRSEGRKMMIYGIVGFFFMVGIYGILSIFTQSFGIRLAIPQFKASQTVTCLE